MTAALWNWSAGEPVPDKPLVVAWPGLLDDEPAPRSFESAHFRSFSAWRRERTLRTFVLPHARWAAGEIASGYIPAAHATTQAELEAALPALMAVDSERRALVLSPREAMRLYEPPTRTEIECGITHPFDDIDLVIITGFSEPIHPEPGRAIVAQCRAAGVPVILLWGEWIAASQVTNDMRELVDHLQACHDIDPCGDVACVAVDAWETYFRVGAGRSGSMLDGERLDALPDWMVRA